MKKKHFLIIFLILATIAGVIMAIFPKRNEPVVLPEEEISPLKDGEKIKLLIENVEFEAEIAKTPAARAKGLGGRADLCPQCGMLFIFESSGYHSFWMKDTLIPLDIIWIDKNWQVVDFVAFAQPQGARSEAELPIYRPQKEARYVLELPGGTVEKIREFKIGSRVEEES